MIPIESLVGPSQDKGKSERAYSVSLTVSEYEGVFRGGSLAFVYDWIDDAHVDSSLEGLRESFVEDWMMDRSYQDATEEPIE